MDTFLIGVASSIVAGFIIYMLRNWIVPLFNNKLRIADDISGDWVGYILNEDGSKEEKPRLRFHINQFGTKVSAKGEMEAKIGVRTFKYHGKFISGQVLFDWDEKKAQNSNIGSLVLRVSGDMHQLKGKSTYFHKDKNEVISEDVIFEKRKVI